MMSREKFTLQDSNLPVRPHTSVQMTSKLISRSSILTPLNPNISRSRSRSVDTKNHYNAGKFADGPDPYHDYGLGFRQSHKYLAPPPTADPVLKIAVPVTPARAKELRRPLTSRLAGTENKHDGKRVETTPIVLVGDSGCGKTSLIMTYLNKRSTIAKKSALFETYDKVINFNNVDTSIKLQIWDFPGDEYFDRFRPLGYANAQGVLICFSIDNPDSFSNIKERWMPEITSHCPKAFKIMVGIGPDRRTSPGKRSNLPSYDQCYKFAKSYGYKYMESSFADQRSCASSFEQIALWAIDDLTKRNKAHKIFSKSPNRTPYKGSISGFSNKGDILYLSPTKTNTTQMPSALLKKDLFVQEESTEPLLESKKKEGGHEAQDLSDNEDETESISSGHELRRQSSFRKHKDSKCHLM
ncbi:hypothetical protein WICPIJ_005738 [Wickerhamomyces pijperi]|uniref:Uncharacterized protein n=1 Tax=Wickerhamomyces pijperi TaxID=599730 RepID=A0A9P8TLM1_WICPI|nr:hypothetical protein WICPIJ_005738 [Wickerhamomyces pijperi]